VRHAPQPGQLELEQTQSLSCLLASSMVHVCKAVPSHRPNLWLGLYSLSVRDEGRSARCEMTGSHRGTRARRLGLSKETVAPRARLENCRQCARPLLDSLLFPIGSQFFSTNLRSELTSDLSGMLHGAMRQELSAPAPQCQMGAESELSVGQLHKKSPGEIHRYLRRGNASRVKCGTSRETESVFVRFPSRRARGLGTYTYRSGETPQL
jgi:hypothetical protein